MGTVGKLWGTVGDAVAPRHPRTNLLYRHNTSSSRPPEISRIVSLVFQPPITNATIFVMFLKVFYAISRFECVSSFSCFCIECLICAMFLSESIFFWYIFQHFFMSSRFFTFSMVVCYFFMVFLFWACFFIMDTFSQYFAGFRRRSLEVARSRRKSPAENRRNRRKSQEFVCHFTR